MIEQSLTGLVLQCILQLLSWSSEGVLWACIFSAQMRQFFFPFREYIILSPWDKIPLGKKEIRIRLLCKACSSYLIICHFQILFHCLCVSGLVKRVINWWIRVNIFFLNFINQYPRIFLEIGSLILCRHGYFANT